MGGPLDVGWLAPAHPCDEMCELRIQGAGIKKSPFKLNGHDAKVSIHKDGYIEWILRDGQQVSWTLVERGVPYTVKESLISVPTLFHQRFDVALECHEQKLKTALAEVRVLESSC